MSLLVQNVSKRYGEKTVVDNISFSVEHPGAFGLLGTNGAGKTTTIRMILGILEKDSGAISWKGKHVSRSTVNFGYLPEERGIYPKARIDDQLLYFAKLRGCDRSAAMSSMTYWCEKLEVAKYLKQPAEQLSKGNQQKVQFVSALLGEPELLILDEPFSGLDPVNSELLKQVIGELVQRGTYIIMSSHQMASIEEFCEDILMLKQGQTILKGNLAEIKRGYGRTNLSVRAQGDISVSIQASGIHIAETLPDGYRLKISNEEQAQALLKDLVNKGVFVEQFELTTPTLHEIFLEKAGGTK